jgi:hypothetical protein
VVALMPTHVNSAITPILNERSPSTVRGCGSAIFEGRQAMPRKGQFQPNGRAASLYSQDSRRKPTYRGCSTRK